MKSNSTYLYIEAGEKAEQQWREKIKQNYPKAEIRSSGAGVLVAIYPGKLYHEDRLGHYYWPLGGFVLRKGRKSP